jgi:hypothetical protein
VGDHLEQNVNKVVSDPPPLLNYEAFMSLSLS